MYCAATFCRSSKIDNRSASIEFGIASDSGKPIQAHKSCATCQDRLYRAASRGNKSNVSRCSSEAPRSNNNRQTST